VKIDIIIGLVLYCFTYFIVIYKVGLINNVLGKPAIFLRGRYVASDFYYFKNSDTFIN
jgi:hypothetical protein